MMFGTSLFGTGTDFDKFTLFYGDIIKKCHEKGIKVYCCTPACIGEKTDYSNPQDGELNELSNIIRQLRSKYNTGLVDIRKAFLEYNLNNNPTNANQGILTNDTVHLKNKGNALVANIMWNKIFQ